MASIRKLTIRLSITALAINLPKNLNFVLSREICDSLAVRPSGLGNRPNCAFTYATGTVGVGPPVVDVVVVVVVVASTRSAAVEWCVLVVVDTTLSACNVDTCSPGVASAC